MTPEQIITLCYSSTSIFVYSIIYWRMSHPEKSPWLSGLVSFIVGVTWVVSIPALIIGFALEVNKKGG